MNSTSAHNGLFRALLVLALILVCFPATSRSQEAPQEYTVKAAILYRFAKFVDWPEDAFQGPSSPIILCVLGEDRFGSSLDFIEGKTVNGRDLVVRRNVNINGLKECHMVFISESEKYRLGQIVDSLRDSSVLTVSDMDHFARSGGIISLKTVDNKIRFEINMESAQRSGLHISSKLLKLSTIVR